MEKGLAWKYYVHNHNENGETKTNIAYVKRVLKGNILYEEAFNAAFQKTDSKIILIESDRWYLKEDKDIRYRWNDSLDFKVVKFEIAENLIINWNGSSAFSDKSIKAGDIDRRVINYQTGNLDSINGNKKYKILSGIRNSITSKSGVPGDTIKIDWKKHFTSDLGMTYSSIRYNNLHIEYELDEIMTLREFEKKSNHGMHRVAYIDTMKTIDDHALFKPCFHQNNIYDYYNDYPAGFLGGKGRLRALLSEKLDPLMIKGNSGYLTFRFVVNCNGEAGWFVTEEADLEFNKKIFSEDCRKHLYDILKSEDKWKRSFIRNEAKDAYTYLTFKMENDEIVEILP